MAFLRPRTKGASLVGGGGRARESPFRETLGATGRSKGAGRGPGRWKSAAAWQVPQGAQGFVRGPLPELDAPGAALCPLGSIYLQSSAVSAWHRAELYKHLLANLAAARKGLANREARAAPSWPGGRPCRRPGSTSGRTSSRRGADSRIPEHPNVSCAHGETEAPRGEGGWPATKQQRGKETPEPRWNGLLSSLGLQQRPDTATGRPPAQTAGIWAQASSPSTATESLFASATIPGPFQGDQSYPWILFRSIRTSFWVTSEALGSLLPYIFADLVPRDIYTWLSGRSPFLQTFLGLFFMALKLSKLLKAWLDSSSGPCCSREVGSLVDPDFTGSR
ncbi:uncharacterized protein LOC141543160 [Sminthopsis crassicaudata]|uniref:uncharacterized protein LOC141543160 n=1 Tax=Sminthopsis crassicaudata TaxID=9301 RepID=UPI003D699DB9